VSLNFLQRLQFRDESNFELLMLVYANSPEADRSSMYANI
jgi:hypothetical protein